MSESVNDIFNPKTSVEISFICILKTKYSEAVSRKTQNKTNG